MGDEIWSEKVPANYTVLDRYTPSQDSGAIPGVSGHDMPNPIPIPGMPQSPGRPGASQQDMLRQLFLRALQAGSRKQLQPPVPGAQGQQQPMTDPMSIGMNTGNPHAWSGVRFSAAMGNLISTAIQKKKEMDVQKAKNDWSNMNAAWLELEAAKQGGNQQEIEAAQKKLDSITGDFKKTKNMAKALQQDWLNPEKTNVYKEGLNQHLAETQATDAKKQQAMQGIKGMVSGLLRRIHQSAPQLSPDQQQRMAREIEGKAPTTSPGAMDPKTFLDVAKGTAELEKASKEARENYAVITSPDGTVWAYNNNDPRDAFQLKDHATGQDIKGQTKVGAAPRVVSTKTGVPYGITRNGQTVTPESAEWTDKDQTLFDAAMKSAKEKQNLRLPAEIAAQVGDPPDPDTFKGGRSSPEYGRALAAWGKQAEAIKMQETAASGVSRAIAWNQYRPVQVMDDNGDVYYTTAKDAIAKGMASAGEGVKLKAKGAQVKDIETASTNLRSAIDNVDRPFNAGQIAKMRTALLTDDPTLASTELAALANDNLTPTQQDMVVWLQQMNERALVLRPIAGIGQSAQDVRNSIRGMLPSLGSGNKAMMEKQLSAFDNQVTILKSGIAKPGKGATAKAAASDTGDTGGFKKNADGSYTEQ